LGNQRYCLKFSITPWIHHIQEKGLACIQMLDLSALLHYIPSISASIKSETIISVLYVWVWFMAQVMMALKI